MNKDDRPAAQKFTVAGKRLAAARESVRVATELLDQADDGLPAEQQAKVGQALYQLGDYDAAREHLTAAFALDSTGERAIRLALTEWRAGNLKAARSWAERAIELDPQGRVEALIAGTSSSYCSVLAEIQLRQGNAKAAAASAGAALGIHREDIAALTILATVRLAEGDHAEALELSQRAFDAAPPFLRAELDKKRTAIDTFRRGGSPMVLDFANVVEIIV
ncbi:tetratricopeptide repeat protein [Spirillospora sp. NPDC050679]